MKNLAKELLLFMEIKELFTLQDHPDFRVFSELPGLSRLIFGFFFWLSVQLFAITLYFFSDIRGILKIFNAFYEVTADFQ